MGTHRKSATVVAIAIAITGGNAHSAGFAVFEQSVQGLGNTFAGGSASAEDASTVFFNPAGMTRLDRVSMQAGLHIIVPQADFNDAGSSLNPAFTGGVSVPGSLTGPTDDGGKTALVPNFYYTRPLGERVFFGLGVNSPYGLATEYRPDWVGRYHAVETELVTVNINPSVAIKATEQLSLAFGFAAQYADAKLTNALDLSAVCLARLSAGTCAATGPGYVTPGTRATDGFQELKVDDWSYGFNIGALFEIDERTRFGVHYRSRISHELTGKVMFGNTAPLAAAFGSGALTNQGAGARLITPETLSLSGYHRLNHSWAVMADATFTRWSKVDIITATFDAGQSNLNLPLHWENTWRLSAGVNHHLNDKWTLRAGATFDQSPTPSAVDRSARIPDTDRIWLGIGASYQYSDNLSFDAGYVHIFASDPDIANADPSFGHRLTGSYDLSVDIISAQLTWKF